MIGVLNKMNIFVKLWKRALTKFGDVMLATAPPKVRAQHIRDLLAVVQVGDILLRKYLYYLDSYFIPGAYTHSGILVDDKNMVHSIAEGVNYIDIIDFVKDCDGFAICRPPYKTDLQKHLSVQFAIDHVGCGYDFFFGLWPKYSNNTFYCHETSIACIDAAGLPTTQKNHVLLADDIINCTELIYTAEV